MDVRIERARMRVLRKLGKCDGGEMSVRYAHQWIANTLNADERWRLLELMVARGDIKHKDGVIKANTDIPSPAYRKNRLPNSEDF